MSRREVAFGSHNTLLKGVGKRSDFPGRDAGSVQEDGKFSRCASEPTSCRKARNVAA
jgi:hypothetical protein